MAENNPFSYMSNDQESHENYSNSSNRHPRHLRGRAIGLWYAQRQRKKSSTSSNSNRGNKSSMITRVELTPAERKHISNLDGISHKRNTKPHSDTLKFDESNQFYETSTIFDDEEFIPLNSFHNSFHYFEPLQQNIDIDQMLFDDLQKKQTSRLFLELEKKRKNLPIAAHHDRILELIDTNQVVIVVGDTGSGKTTQIVQFVLDSQIRRKCGSFCRIICSQPRRISATSISERVAHERGENSQGDSVGYHIRLSAKFPRKFGSILFCTTGMLLKYLEQYEDFEHFSHIILDEVHERSIEMDFLLIFIRRLIERRSDVKILLMSASIQAEKFSKYFNNCPIVNIPGSLHPIREYYLEDYIDKLRYPYERRFQRNTYHNDDASLNQYLDELQFDLASQSKPIEVWKSIQAIGTDFHPKINCRLVVCVIDYICRKSRSGTILVFLPGWGEISQCSKLLREESQFVSSLRILPLHSLLPLNDQHEIFKKPERENIRKVILSTSIAESSITVEDVVYVVDTGRTKGNDYDLETQGKSLLPINVSKANLIQRKGRAGRTCPGECYRLFTRCNERLRFSDFPQPEMITTRLDQIYLQAKLLKISNVENFLGDALDPPAKEAINHAEDFLVDLGAITNDRLQLTALGQILAHLPMSPQIGKLLIMGYLFHCFDPILTIASILSYRDPFVIPVEKSEDADFVRRQFSKGTMSDHLMLINVYNQWRNQRSFNEKNRFCFENFLNLNNMNMIDKVRIQLKRFIEDYFGPCTAQTNEYSENQALISAVMCSGLYPNIARLSYVGGKSATRVCKFEGKLEKNLSIHPKSVNSKLKVNDVRRSLASSIFIVYYEKIRTTSIYIHDATFVSSYSLLFFGKSQLASTESTFTTNRNDDELLRVLIDRWIEISIDRSTYQIIDELKQKFNQLLEMKSSTKNTSFSNEKELIDAIIRFVTKTDRFPLEQERLIDRYCEDKQKLVYEDWD